MKNTFLKIIFVMGSLLWICTQSFAESDVSKEVVHLSTNDFNEWKLRGPRFMSKWAIGDVKIDPENEEKLIVLLSGKEAAALINKQKGMVDILTKQDFGDCVLELEVMVPKHSNSGIYLMGQYEVQVKDSYGKGQSVKEDDMGGIFDTSKPLLNAAGKPGEWQKYLIEFSAPHFENGKRIQPAEFVKVVLNGQVVQKNVIMENGPTKGALQKKEIPKGPLMLQGSMGPVAYRNIRITLPD
jgi:hypothetical protein